MTSFLETFTKCAFFTHSLYFSFFLILPLRDVFKFVYRVSDRLIWLMIISFIYFPIYTLPLFYFQLNRPCKCKTYHRFWLRNPCRIHHVVMSTIRYPTFITFWWMNQNHKLYKRWKRIGVLHLIRKCTLYLHFCYQKFLMN